MRRLKIVDQLWKDYLQDMALHILYRWKKDLVFRGGTCIWKVYRGDRFSEDLDLCSDTMPESTGEHVTKELGYMGFSCEISRRKQTTNMELTRLSVTSPTHPRPVMLQIEVLASPECALKAVPTTMYSPYPDIPPVDMLVPSAGDLALDKVSAIYGRNKPRDIHDLHILLKQGAGINVEDVCRRIPEFTMQEFRKRMEEKRKFWNSLNALLVARLPSFDEEINFIMGSLQE